MGLLKTLSSVVAVSLLITAIWAVDISYRFTPIVSFKEDKSVTDINNNFRRLTKVIFDDSGFNITATNGTTMTQVAFVNAQTNTEYGVFAQVSWNADARVLQKTTTGFVLQYTDPAANGKTFDWILVR